ncbi:glycosyltransferase family 10 domain-containing protein [Candidatus Vampirococcus lugosii]|uniref:Glycosyltransferase, family 10 (Fucosyltransferase) n=1 Tax=Candidatus Vampirococcus lugosii TaxID=2789015 RepID=A0ABS5QLP5_9BACT|nr:glycosyltransferase family 10 [Candidatus Vampirococcus lugosii]MBS8122117.1 Glycosyltransferase, family 10 (fucosyltransferase) [Candidatus Vampirococcus lugosii]
MSKKLKLFYIVAFEEQTYNFENKIENILNLMQNGKKQHITTLENHFLMLSKHFNIYNFYKYKDNIEKENSIIYHLPNGRDDEKGVEEELLKYKGKVPIVMRSYDAHSPNKASIDYMEKYHDLIITYLKKHVNNNNIFFGHMCYDNHIMHTYQQNKSKKLACMILRNREESSYNKDYSLFIEKGIDLLKNYKERKKITKYTDIHIYGTGWSIKTKNYYGPINPFDKKYHVLGNYKFNFVLENVITKTHISEKTLDSFLSFSVPVYLGAPDINKHIPKETFININDFQDYDDLLNFLKNMTIEEYNKYINSIEKNRNIIFKQFSTEENFSKIVYNWYNNKYKTNFGLSNDEYKEIEQSIGNLKFKSSSVILSNLYRYLYLFKLYLLEYIRK